jgi:hypothetical protein
MGTMWAKICCAPNHWHSTKNAGDVENLNNGKKKKDPEGLYCCCWNQIIKTSECLLRQLMN